MNGMNSPKVRRRLAVLQPSDVFPRYAKLGTGKGILKRILHILAQPARLAEYRINKRTLDETLERMAVIPAEERFDLCIPEDITADITFPVDAFFEQVYRLPTASTGGIIDLSFSPEEARKRYEGILLLYPDAIGVGWGRIERRLRRLGLPMTVRNGRGREFELDGPTQRSLRIRRFLERIWGAELAFGAVFAASLPAVLLQDILGALLRSLLGRRWRRPAPPVRDTEAEKRPDDVRHWWSRNPMVYGDTHGKPVYGRAQGKAELFELGDEAFFAQVDHEFYYWNHPLHGPGGKFSRLYPYDRYKDARVLEVGCGMGTMSMNWALQGAKVTPIDLTPTAVKQTKRRFELKRIDRTPCQAQAERLPFPDNTFDYVYSWGVLHHTPNTAKTIEELHRVVKPGGSVGVMLYNRESILYRFWVRFYEGWLHRESRFLDQVALGSRYGDGSREDGNPHTWPVTKSEVYRSLFTPFARVRTRLLGTELDNIFKRAMPGLGHVMPRFIKKAYARNWGWSMWIEAEKSADDQNEN